VPFPEVAQTLSITRQPGDDGQHTSLAEQVSDIRLVING
jgi:hypothetical protein